MALHFTADVVNMDVGYNIKIVGTDVNLFDMTLPSGYKLYAKKSEVGAVGKGLTYNDGTEAVPYVKLSGDTLQDLNTSLKAQLFIAKDIDEDAPEEALVENVSSLDGTALGQMTIADIVNIA